MNPKRPQRRTFLKQLAVLGAAGAGYVFVRQHLVWPTPDVVLAQGRWSGWMPLPEPGGLVALPARIGGERILAVLDSGAQYTAVDSGLAERLKLPAATPVPMIAFGVSGGPSVTRAVKLDVDLGAVAIRGMRAATLNLRALSGLTAQPFSLLLGRDFLRGAVAEVDLPGGRLSFHEPETWRPPADARAVTVRLENGGIMAEVKVEDAPPIEVMVDTGATGALALSEEAARAAGLLDGRPMRRSHSVTLGGVSQDGVVRARRLEFAGRVFENVEVQTYTPAANAPVPDGLLGLGVLDRFRFALDLPRGRLFLIGPERPPRRQPTRRGARFEASAGR